MIEACYFFFRHPGRWLAVVAFFCLSGCYPSPSAGPGEQGNPALIEELNVENFTHGRAQMAVVSGSPESTRIGMDILLRGGNAADAAVAVSFALGVAEPYGSGCGGKAAVLFYHRASGHVYFIDGMDESPRQLSVERFISLPANLRRSGFAAVAVPGQVAAMDELHQRFSSLPWRDLVLPAAALARDGFLVSGHDAALFQLAVENLQRDNEASRIFLPGGLPPAEGSRLGNPDLAASLEAIASGGAREFYEGELALRIANAVQKRGGFLTVEDLASYRAHWPDPLRLVWRDCEVFSAPSPVTGGATLLLALHALQALPVSGGVGETEHFHRLAIALRTVYPVVNRLFGDAPSLLGEQQAVFSTAGLEAIAAAAIRDSTGFSRAQTGPAPAGGLEESTSHFIVVDAEGNVASVTQSLSSRFGAAVVAPGTGILLNNSMNNFALRTASSPNLIAPGKRPRSTIAPTIITKDGRVRFAVGSPAGQRIPPSLLQVISAVFEYGTTASEAILAPRFHLNRPILSRDSDRLIEFEEGIGLETALELMEMGWQVNFRSSDHYYFGGVNAVMIDESGYIVEAVADPRRSNSVLTR